jgi:hypothetical protein
MESTRSNRPRQADPSKVRADALPYAQIPLCLLELPLGDQLAAIHVWVALHGDLRLGTTLRPLTDATLKTSPVVAKRCRRFRCAGLDTLERAGLITRVVAGSSRLLAIAIKLKGQRPSAPVSAGQRPSARNQVDLLTEIIPTQWDMEYYSRLPNLAKLFADCAHQDAHKV